MSFMPAWCRLILLPVMKRGTSPSRATSSAAGRASVIHRVEQQHVRGIEQQRHEREPQACRRP